MTTIKQVDIIHDDGNLYGFRLGNAVVYATGTTIDEAFLQAWESLEYEDKQESPSIRYSEEEVIRNYVPPAPTPTTIHLTADRTHAFLADEPAVFILSATIRDQYKQKMNVEVEWEGAKGGVLTATSPGEYVVTVKVGDLKRSITLHVEEYVESETSENIESKIERLEKESVITMAALADKHEETLQLQQKNEELMQMNLIALEGVAILNEEVQQLKNKNEASAD